MNRKIPSVLSASELIFAQTAKALVGMFTLVAVTPERDGKTDMYGANPQGQAKRLFSNYRCPGCQSSMHESRREG